jgi:GT2 family glycosyltransferase
MNDELIYQYENNRKEILEELFATEKYESVSKDILIVIKDQFDYISNCLKSIFDHTEDFQLFLWDNGSKEKTANYLKKIAEKENVFLHRQEENQGFIVPNNSLAKMGSSPYIVLLNSDTVVYTNWDKTLIAWLQQNQDVAAVGYEGSKLDDNFRGGGKPYFGYEPDYINGWCLAFSRTTFNQFGLFDQKNLEWAYGEDSDFSLRLKEAGKRIYACHCPSVYHFGNKTVQEIANEGVDFSGPFERNHAYLRKRWCKSIRGKV